MELGVHIFRHYRSDPETHESGVYHSIFIVHGGTPPPYDEGNVRPIRIAFKIPTATLGLFWLNSNEHFPYDRMGSGVPL